VKFRLRDLRFDAPDVVGDVVGVDVGDETATAVAIVVVVTPAA
jgi:hypothetical protein